MEFLYGNYPACPQDLAAQVNTDFETIACPIDPATEWPWFKQ